MAVEDLEESEGEDIIEPGDETNVKIQEQADDDSSENESDEEEQEEDIAIDNKKGGDVKHINISKESIKDISIDNLNLII